MIKSGETPQNGKLEKKGFLKTILGGNAYVLLSFFCSGVIMLLVFYCFSVNPFGGKTILRMDLYHQYGPLFAELYERLKSGGSLLYSWSTGLGGSFLGNFFNYLSSPLAVVILFFNHVGVVDAIALMILLKCAFSSASFCYYIKNSLGRHDHVSVAFSVLYSFCGFFIAYYWNVMWLDAMMLFPLVILGIERIIDKRKWLLYLVTLSLILISNYYMATMVCLFSILYFLYRYFSVYSINSPVCENSGKGIVARLKNSRFLSSGFTFAAVSLTAVLLALFALLPTLFILRTCSATSGSWPGDAKFYYSIFDFLANHFAGLSPTIRSSGENVLPNIYCGILTIILVPLYLLTKSISLKEKTLTVLFLGIFYFSFNLNYINYIWHGLHFPNDLPYRFSYIYSFFLIVLALKAFERLDELSGKEIFLSGLGVVFFLIVVQKIGSKNVDTNTVLVTLAFSVLYTLVLCLFRTKKYQTTSLALLLLCCVISESAIANTKHYVMNQTKESYTGDYNEFAKIKSELDEYDGGLYRMELTNLRTRMDPAWYFYNGISVFSSMTSEKLSNLQSHMGIYGNYINSFTYNPQTPVYNAVMGLKYVVNNSKTIKLENDRLYTKIITSDNFDVFENIYSLPVAFCAGSAVKGWVSDDESPFDVQSDFFYKATGLDGVFNDMELVDVYYDNIQEFYAGLDTGILSFIKENDANDGSVTFTFTPTETQNCYLYVKSRSVDSISVSHANLDRSQDIDEAYILDLGICEAGGDVVVNVPLKDESNSGSVNIYACSIDMDAFKAGYEILQRGGLKIDKFGDTHISGTFTAPENSVLYTSVPYDDGWKIYIDGERVSRDKYIKLADALLAVSVTPGEHTITMDYSPVGFKFGCAVSGSTLLLIIAFFIIKSLRNKKKRALENEPSFPVYIEAAAQDGEEADVQDGVEADVQDDEADVQDDEAAAAQDEEEITAQGEEEAAAQDGAEISEEPS
jgi:uncharacterized membrane protein YfhO